MCSRAFVLLVEVRADARHRDKELGRGELVDVAPRDRVEADARLADHLRRVDWEVLVVGAAAIKFGGERPNLMQLLDWAWESLSSSLASSGPSSPVRR